MLVIALVISPMASAQSSGMRENVSGTGYLHQH
jgi:hypothetical protein